MHLNCLLKVLIYNQSFVLFPTWNGITLYRERYLFSGAKWFLMREYNLLYCGGKLIGCEPTTGQSDCKPSLLHPSTEIYTCGSEYQNNNYWQKFYDEISLLIISQNKFSMNIVFIWSQSYLYIHYPFLFLITVYIHVKKNQ